MAAGLPTLGFSNSYQGLGAMHGVNCYVCTSASELSAHTLGLINDKDRRLALGRSASSSTRLRFSNVNIGNEIFAIYNDSIKNHNFTNG